MTQDSHVACYRADTGEQVTKPRTWVDNSNIFGGLFVSTKPVEKAARVRRDTVEAPTATPADLITDTAPSAGDNTKE